MGKTFTCKDCDDREPGCHSKCEKYKKEKSRWEKEKASMKIGHEADEYTLGRIYKAKDRNDKRSKRFSGNGKMMY